MRSSYKVVICLLLSLFIFSCGKEEQPAKPCAFYYWRTTFNLDTTELRALKTLNVKHLYVRYFDLDVQNDSIVPVGEISGLQNIPDSTDVTPVIFITNRCFQNTSTEEINRLSFRVANRIRETSIAAGLKLKGVQFDCDWTDKTKYRYFHFLDMMNKEMEGSHITATIRLHQVKYAAKTGVPPIREGVLMLYNIGNILQQDSLNSIYNSRAADKYTRYVAMYPLKLSVALPIFSWQAQYRKGKLINLLAKDEKINLENSERILMTKKPGYHVVVSSFLENGNYFKQGDELKEERLSFEELKEAAEKVYQHMKSDSFEIIFYDLDKTNLKNYTHEELQKILAAFN